MFCVPIVGYRCGVIRWWSFSRRIVDDYTLIDVILAHVLEVMESEYGSCRTVMRYLLLSHFPKTLIR